MTETFDKAAGSPDHTVQFELSNYSDNSGSGSDAESGENSEKLTCQTEHHTTRTKSQLNIEKLSEEIVERFSAKFQDSSIAKDIAREVIKLLDTSNEQECKHKKENVWHDGGDDEIICIPCSVFSSHEKVPKELKRFHEHGFGTFTKISETASIQTNKDRSKRINVHLESPLHVWCTNFSELEAENEEKRKTTNEKLCTKIVTNAIYCFRTSGSSYDFVRLNNKDELTAEVFGESATKNDGREQFFELRNIVFDKLSDYIKRLFQTLKTASFSLDKVTVGGVPYTVRTGDLFFLQWTKIHCEAIREAVGSIMTIAMGTGKNLSPVNLSKEVCLRFNLPPLHICKKSIIPIIIQDLVDERAKTYRRKGDKDNRISRFFKYTHISSALGNFRKKEEDTAHLPIEVFKG
ncbi:Hypothetical predicted protein [Paramuricea clavata]|uniref:Uncharacterized protein n=1 Tax=Paramuricea clavata TaxID=317549 RepID=A0A6S7LSL3_PARCT|nr:Hypothetical predicted protein [Paramuricea clavata]